MQENAEIRTGQGDDDDDDDDAGPRLQFDIVDYWHDCDLYNLDYLVHILHRDHIVVSTVDAIKGKSTSNHFYRLLVHSSLLKNLTQGNVTLSMIV